MSDKAWTAIFCVCLCAVTALASFPGIFDWSNTIEPWVFGLPFASFWQILLSCLGIAIIGIYYVIEDKRGSLDYDLADEDAQG